MAYEIFGFVVKPELSIGDIAAIAALITSALIFWFGYSRTRKSEQIKIDRDLMDRIELKLQPVLEFLKPEDNAFMYLHLSQQYQPYDWNESGWDEKKGKQFIFIGNLLNLISTSLNEMDYFSYLVRKREIEDSILIHYYKPRIDEILGTLADLLVSLEPALEWEWGVAMDELKSKITNDKERLIHNTKAWKSEVVINKVEQSYRK